MYIFAPGIFGTILPIECLAVLCSGKNKGYRIETGEIEYQLVNGRIKEAVVIRPG
ncbi:hypothetical protein MuYL_1969 [Mucilaginibacter xinganensis]|uniref:Uncharacterized protein n=1 Tax=Mucilaginibacter xinganensis TaxID=1234841 RepID=A0A223NVG5_9SPHI|nr:hypothetical protein MuYL_1969 [Mucilaginibacter xinganensis]